MKRFVSPLAVLCASILGACCFSSATVSAETLAEPVRVASDTIIDALGGEVDDADARREPLQRSALEKSPDDASARWRDGYVRWQDRWVKFDRAPSLARAEQRYQEYLGVRPEYPDTVPGQLELARWCKKRRLADQACAHFIRVLQFDPNHRLARAALGFRNSEGIWFTREQLDDFRERIQRFRRNEQKWRPKIEHLRRKFARKNEQRREEAREQLQAIGEPEAVWALVAVLGSSTESEASLLVEILDGIYDQEGALALCHQAVFSEWETVRRTAAEKLKARPMEEFVPAMLEAMQVPPKVRHEVELQPAAVVERRTVTRERWLTKDETIEESVFWGPRRMLRLWPPQQREREGENAWNRAIWLAQQNARTHSLNQRVAAALNIIANQQLPPLAKSCWDWWNDYCDQLIADKPVRRTLAYRDYVFVAAYSCFAEGTPIWTIDGLRPIEHLQVGDLVLSQNPETGELAYKPVVRTTRREAAPLMTVPVGAESLTCTKGHLFWACGLGWVQARHLNTGDILHCVNGAAVADAAQPGPTARTFNLVVADFNTYFVGGQRILVHDVTPRQPPATLLSGLAVR